MTGHLLAQLAVVASREAEAITQPYAWPPRGPLTADEQAGVAHLDALSRRLSAEAEAAGCSRQGTDYLFGNIETALGSGQ